MTVQLDSQATDSQATDPGLAPDYALRRQDKMQEEQVDPREEDEHDSAGTDGIAQVKSAHAPAAALPGC